MEVGAHCERSKGKKKKTYKPTVKQKREQGLEERKEINLCGEIAVVTNETYATPLIQFSGRVNGKEGEILLDSGSSSNFCVHLFCAQTSTINREIASGAIGAVGRWNRTQSEERYH